MRVGTIKQDQEKDQEVLVKSACALEAEPEKTKAPRWKQGSRSALLGHIGEEPQIQRETKRSCRTCGDSLMPAQSLN